MDHIMAETVTKNKGSQIGASHTKEKIS